MALAHPVWTSRFHQPYHTRGGEVRHNGRAKGYRQILKEVPHAVVNLIPIFIPCSSFLSPFRSWGIHPQPQFEIQYKISNSFFSSWENIFPNWESDFLCAFQSHDKGTTSVGGSHTLPYDFTCYLAVRASWRFALLRGLLPGVLAVVAAEGFHKIGQLAFSCATYLLQDCPSRYTFPSSSSRGTWIPRHLRALSGYGIVLGR